MIGASIVHIDIEFRVSGGSKTVAGLPCKARITTVGAKCQFLGPVAIQGRLMANIHVRDIPDDLWKALRLFALQQDLKLKNVVAESFDLYLERHTEDSRV